MLSLATCDAGQEGRQVQGIPTRWDAPALIHEG